MPATTWIRNLALALALFSVGAAGGVWFASEQAALVGMPEDIPPFSTQAFLAAADAPEDRASLSTGIFARNLSVYALLLAGLISGGLTTVLTLAFNGFSLGQLFGMASLVGAPLAAPLWLVAPHGILELSLLFLAAAIGLQGPAAALAWTAGTKLSWRPRHVGITALVGVPLLAMAAAIEGYLTMPLAKAALLP